MVDRKKIRTRGKLQLSRYFQELKNGQNVAVIREKSVTSNFPRNIQGRTGIVKAKRGSAYIVEINDHDKMKQYILKPIHLKKIKQSSKVK